MVSKHQIKHLIVRRWGVISTIHKLFLAFISRALHFTSPLKSDVVLWLSSANDLWMAGLQVNLQFATFPSHLCNDENLCLDDASTKLSLWGLPVG